MCLAQGPQRGDAGEARTRGPSVSSQALYHWATALPLNGFNHTVCMKSETNADTLRSLYCEYRSIKDRYEIVFFFLTHQLKPVFWGAQKKRLIETVLLSTRNICFGWEIGKIVFQYALLSGGQCEHTQYEPSLVRFSNIATLKLAYHPIGNYHLTWTFLIHPILWTFRACI